MELFTGIFGYQEWGQKSKWRQMWLFVKAGAGNCDASANLKIKEVLKVKYFEVKRIIIYHTKTDLYFRSIKGTGVILKQDHLTPPPPKKNNK